MSKPLKLPRIQNATSFAIKDIEAVPSPKKEHAGLPSFVSALATHAKPWHFQIGLAVTQTLFVIGSVYLKRCLQLLDAAKGPAFHPIIYAFSREAIAGPILWTLSFCLSGKWLPVSSDYLRVSLLGSFLFLNQLFFILGIALSGVVVATCIQPVIPVLTAALAVMMKMESGSVQKFCGIALAVGGSISMVLGGIGTSSHHSAAESRSLLIGNVCLMANTISMSMYYLSAKQLVQKYSPMSVTAWAYIMAAALMGLTACITIDYSQWSVPRQLFGPLLYWVVVCSVVGYWVVTAATQYLPASQVASFQCLQPFVGTALAIIVLGEEATWWDLGAVGVIMGLVLVTSDTADMQYLNPMFNKMKRIISQSSMYGKSSAS